MVRFNDKPLITTLSDDDIMPITDMSEPSSDKKMNMKQLSEYVANLASHDVASAFKALGTETVSSDSSAYKEILDRKHSTFDRSKFHVVNNPTITDDGIASGFSGSNLLYLDTKFSSPKEIIYNLSIICTGSIQGEKGVFNAGIFRLSDNGIFGNYNSCSVWIEGPNSFGFDIHAKQGDVLKFKFVATATSLELDCINESQNITYHNKVNTSLDLSITQVLCLGSYSPNYFPYNGGIIDLSQFSITVDGVEVFNGNKTGIDQIKADKFTKVGNPEVNEYGIFEYPRNGAVNLDNNDFYFTSSSYGNNNLLLIQEPLTISGSSWDVYFRCYTDIGDTVKILNQGIFAMSTGVGAVGNIGPRRFTIYMTPYGHEIYLQLGKDEEADMGSYGMSVPVKEWIDVRISYNNKTIIMYCNGSIKGTTSVDLDSYSVSMPRITLLNAEGLYRFSGKLDVSSFKIYVGGNLIYQPTLTIPYIQSKTGSKIVNATYRNRVFDLYEQTGKALYYTIDEKNKNFTAPLSDIYGMITDNASLKNFTPEGKDRFEAQNAYLTGDVLKEEQGLNQVKMMKRSTFDRSKFHVVDNPTITDDGMYTWSGDLSNRLRIDEFMTNIDFNRPFKMTFRFIHNKTASNWLFGMANDYAGGCIHSWSSSTGYLEAFCIEVWDSINNKNVRLNFGNSSIIPMGAIVDISIEWIGIAYTVKAVDITSGELYMNATLESNLPLNTSFYLDGINKVIMSPQAYFCDFDLKYTRFEQDGVEVFNGNKTGIDQIKKDDYTVNGNPTITDDGIFIGGNGKTVNKSDLNIPIGSNFDIYYSFKTKQINSANGLFEIYASSGTATTSRPIYARFETSKFLFVDWYDNNGNEIMGHWEAVATLKEHTGYTIHLKSKDGVCFLYFKEDGLGERLIRSRNTTPQAMNNIVLGLVTNIQYALDTNIDLNSFKIYVDGNLIYQPTLRIPYTQSKTGSKIANIGSRDRVQDMHEQFGYAPYYTLEDDSFTLPKGEVYGLIGSRSLKSHFRSGINYYDVYSDRELEQGGACTANVAVNLLKPYEDANYVLSVPYSAKTATSFTPTTTGTWMAKGIAKSLD